jgi:hypothetical protein
MTPEIASKMCPGAKPAAIAANLPLVLAGLAHFSLDDPQMQLMAVATIRVECSGFEPLEEFISKYNTPNGGLPFSLYDPGTRIGRNLGNTEPGDGARFRGRGFVQLTGRANYFKFGPVVGYDLMTRPELANDPDVAALVLAAFLKSHELAIRAALASYDFEGARRLVNGGTHGLAEFQKAFQDGAGMMSMPLT